MATLFQLPKSSPVFSGDSLPGGKLYFFQSGTLTPIVTYTTAALSVAHAHPVVADSDGVFAPIFFNENANVSYRVQLKDADDVLQYDVDNITIYNSTVELGGQTDTTLSRASAGVLAVEGHNVPTVDQAQSISAAWSFSAEITGTTEAGTTAAAFRAAALVPAYRWYRTAASTDNKVWQASAGVSSWGLYALDDSYDNPTNVLLVNRSGTTISDFRVTIGGTESVRVDSNATAGNTRFMIYDVDNATLERVSVGANDSGGAGFKLLRIPN